MSSLQCKWSRRARPHRAGSCRATCARPGRAQLRRRSVQSVLGRPYYNLHADLGGFLYLTVVLDTFSRRIVGWTMETQLRTELVLQARNMAFWQRLPAAVSHHSDQGSQYRNGGNSILDFLRFRSL